MVRHGARTQTWMEEMAGWVWSHMSIQWIQMVQDERGIQGGSSEVALLNGMGS